MLHITNDLIFNQNLIFKLFFWIKEYSVKKKKKDQLSFRPSFNYLKKDPAQQNYLLPYSMYRLISVSEMFE